MVLVAISNRAYLDLNNFAPQNITVGKSAERIRNVKIVRVSINTGHFENACPVDSI